MYLSRVQTMSTPREVVKGDRHDMFDSLNQHHAVVLRMDSGKHNASSNNVRSEHHVKKAS